LHEGIERGVAAVNAFEIAICLFTGGIILLGGLSHSKQRQNAILI
jgi:hypothetical protein